MLWLVLAALLAWAQDSSADQAAYRLSSDVLPTHYILEMETDLDTFKFLGKVWITLHLKKPTNEIRLHTSNLTINEKRVTFKHVDSEKNVKLPIARLEFNKGNEMVTIKLGKKAIAGKGYVLHMSFSGTLSEGLAGFYRSSYDDQADNKTKWMAVTQFAPTDARKAFPCFDEPEFKARFTIKMAHTANLKAISNMPITRSWPFKGRSGWVWDKFQDTVPMSTYLVAYMLSEFDHRESEPQPNKVLFRVWARRDAIQQVEFARKVGPKFLSYYEQYFDVAYPLPKQDMVAVPDFSAGAMENWGLITYRETALLYDEAGTSQSSKYYIASTIAHELAHQWFGNLVTMRWWTDLWLNEGFATYVAGLGVHHEFPELNWLDDEAVGNLLLVFSLDSLASSHPVSVAIGHPSEITQIFDPISYKKGAFLLRMMNLFLGEEVFRTGVSEYLKKHRYGNAEQDDLWASLTEQAHKSKVLPSELTVKKIMDSWTVQTGYPLVTVKRDYETGQATMTQERYLVDVKADASGCWWVPVTVSSAKRPDFNKTRPTRWLNCEDDEASMDTRADKRDYVILNNKFAGLYRVNYDEENWKLIIATLRGSEYTSIDVLNRVQLLADAMELAWRGDLPYAHAFDLLGYLRQESTYQPWRSGLSSLSSINTMMRHTPKYGHFRNYVRHLLEPMVLRVGRMTEVPATFEAVKHKSLVLQWACALDVGDCISQANQLFAQWKNSSADNNPIPKDLRSLVYCRGAKEGGEEAWQLLWQRYRESNVGTEQSLMLAALACSQEVWLINRYLEWSIDKTSGIRKQDSSTVFAQVARSDIGYYLALKFLERNIHDIYDYYGPSDSRLGQYLKALAGQIIYPDELEELRKLTEVYNQYFTKSQLSVKQSLETITNNVAWHRAHYQTIDSVLAV